MTTNTTCDNGKLNDIIKKYIESYNGNQNDYLNAIFELYNTDDENNKKIKLILLTSLIKEKGFKTLIESTDKADKIIECIGKNELYSKGICDLKLFELIVYMRLDLLIIFLLNDGNNYFIEEVCKFYKNKNFYPIIDTLDIKYNDENGYKQLTKDGVKSLFNDSASNAEANENVIKSIKKILEIFFIEEKELEMREKIHIYIILDKLIKDYYKQDANSKIKIIFDKITTNSDKCAPRSFIDIKTNTSSQDGGSEDVYDRNNTGGTSQGGGYKKGNGIEYNIIRSNFKKTFDKILATSAREGAKKIAMEILKGRRKSATFSLKDKEKIYNYITTIDTNGKISIKTIR